MPATHLWEERLKLDLVRSNATSRIALGITVFASAILLVMLGSILYNFWLDSAARAAAAGTSWQESLQGEMLVMAVVLSLVEALACIALAAIIRNAFTASMGNRVHQAGLLSTVGATPRQLRRLLVREALAASALPLAAGSALGTLFAGAFINAAMERSLAIDPNQTFAGYHCPPELLVALALLALITILASAESPARALAKTSPLLAAGGCFLPDEQANSTTAKTPRIRFAPRAMRAALGGIETQLAWESMRSRATSLRASRISLFLALLAFGTFLSFMTVSKASVEESFYQRFGISWTVTADVPDVSQEELAGIAQALEASGVAQRALVDGSDAGSRIYASAAAGTTEAELAAALEHSLSGVGSHAFTLVDLAEEKRESEAIWHGWVAVFGGFCALLALVGMVGVLTQAICSVTQRGKEFARLRSLGLTPSGVTKMLALEGAWVVSLPLAAALPFMAGALIALTLLANQSFGAVLASFPWMAFIGFLAALFAAAIAAYGIGAWRINRSDLAACLKDNAFA